MIVFAPLRLIKILVAVSSVACNERSKSLSENETGPKRKIVRARRDDGVAYSGI